MSVHDAYPENVRGNAISLYLTGKGYRTIASELGLSRDTVRNWIISYKRKSAEAVRSLEGHAVDEERVYRYLGGRYGQSQETKVKYQDAINASSSIECLGMTIGEIARMHGVDAQGLRNQLLRHFPNVIPLRNKLRGLMGYQLYSRADLHEKAIERYSEAVQMLRETDLTLTEVAAHCGLSASGLQQHLLFYHRDVAEKRLGQRLTVLDNDALQAGEKDCNNRPHGPKAASRSRYAPAIEMLQTTDIPLVEVAKRCKLSPGNLRAYARKWHPDLMLSRRRQREEQAAAARADSLARKTESKTSQAQRLYSPAVEMIRGGMNLSKAAAAIGADVSRLSAWMKKHHPQVLEEAGIGMIRLENGEYVSRGRYRKFLPVAEYLKLHPAESTQAVASRFGVAQSSLQKVVPRLFPDIWQSHLDACSALREKAGKQYRQMIQSALEEYEAGGVRLEDLAQRCGINVKTLSNWRSLFKKEETKHK